VDDGDKPYVSLHFLGAAGVRLDVVSRQLGHASIATTGNIYTHDRDEAAAEEAATVASFLDGRR
jgi:integrase